MVCFVKGRFARKLRIRKEELRSKKNVLRHSVFRNDGSLWGLVGEVGLDDAVDVVGGGGDLVDIFFKLLEVNGSRG